MNLQLEINLATDSGLRPSGRMDNASATEMVHLALIPGRVKPKTIKIDVHSFPAQVLAHTFSIKYD